MNDQQYVDEIAAHLGGIACYADIRIAPVDQLIQDIDRRSKEYLSSNGSWSDPRVLYVRLLAVELNGLLMRRLRGVAYDPVPIATIRQALSQKHGMRFDA